MIPIKHLFIIIPVCLFCSCSFQRDKKLIDRAAELVEEKPDSALLLLNSVDARSLNDLQYARLVVFNVRAKEKVGQDIAGDTVVFEARDYLMEKNEAKDAAMGCFVSANIYEAQGKVNKAIQQYQKAAQWSEKTNNYQLSGYIYYNMAWLYEGQYQYRESLSCLQKTFKYESMSNGKYTDRIYTLELMGFNYVGLHLPDSALIYHDRALELARLHNDSLLERNILQNMSVAYNKEKNYRLARENCLKALALTNPGDSIEVGKLNLIMAGICFGEERFDAAYEYIYKAKVLDRLTDELVDLIELYKLLSSIEEKKGNYELALHYQQLYTAYIKSREYIIKQMQEEQKKYQGSTIQSIRKERDRLIMQRRILYVAVSSCAIIFLILGTFYWYRRRMKRRIANIRNHSKYLREKMEEEVFKFSRYKEQLEKEKREEITAIRKIANDDQLRMIFHVKDLAALKEMLDAREINLKDTRRQVKKMIGKSSWDEIYPILNNSNQDVFNRIKDDFPVLNEKEYRTCCLAYVGYGNSEISLIVDEATNTIQNRKTAIRKKLAMETREDFREFFSNLYRMSSN